MMWCFWKWRTLTPTHRCQKGKKLYFFFWNSFEVPESSLWFLQSPQFRLKETSFAPLGVRLSTNWEKQYDVKITTSNIRNTQCFTNFGKFTYLNVNTMCSQTTKQKNWNKEKRHNVSDILSFVIILIQSCWHKKTKGQKQFFEVFWTGVDTTHIGVSVLDPFYLHEITWSKGFEDFPRQTISSINIGALRRRLWEWRGSWVRSASIVGDGRDSDMMQCLPTNWNKLSLWF